MRVQGQVLDSQTGLPVPGVRVYLPEGKLPLRLPQPGENPVRPTGVAGPRPDTFAAAPADRLQLETSAESAGRFVFGNLRPGQYRLGATGQSQVEKEGLAIVRLPGTRGFVPEARVKLINSGTIPLMAGTFR